MKETQLTSTFNLENALEKLESIVSRMEKGTLSLDSTLSEFKDGIGLVCECRQALKQAEQTVSLLIEHNGESVLAPYLPEETEENNT